MILLLKKRGAAISCGDFDTVRSVDVEISALIADKSKKGGLIKPSAVFITFVQDDCQNLCDEISKEE